MNFQDGANLLEAFDQEIVQLCELGYPKAMGLKQESFLREMTFLKNGLKEFLRSLTFFEIRLDGEIPLLVIFPPEALSYDAQLKLIKNDGQFCHAKLDEVDNQAFRMNPYVILNIKMGVQHNGHQIRSPLNAELYLIKSEAGEREQRGLNLEEGIALLRFSKRLPRIERRQFVLTRAGNGEGEDRSFLCIGCVLSVCPPSIQYLHAADSSSIYNQIVNCAVETVIAPQTSPQEVLGF